MSWKEVERIIRVDHAGEFGAIGIYKAQRLVAGLFYQDIVEQLDEMLAHERQHYDRFHNWLVKNGVRHCYALWFWGLGGMIIGFITALLGRRAIWVCTHTIESTVLHHLEQQLSFLQAYEKSAYEVVLSIKKDEEEHQAQGKLHGSSSMVYYPIKFVIKYSTKSAIWLSTKL